MRERERNMAVCVRERELGGRAVRERERREEEEEEEEKNEEARERETLLLTRGDYRGGPEKEGSSKARIFYVCNTR